MRDIFSEIIEDIEEWGDLFAGGGGTTEGALQVPGVRVLWALNHSREAIMTHEINHPETKHYWADIYETDEQILPKIKGLWASIECTMHSRAKGGKEKEIGSYTMGYELPRFIEATEPFKIIVENVREFLYWSPLKDKNGKVCFYKDYCKLSKEERNNLKMQPDKTRKGEEYKMWVKHIQDMGYPYYDYRVLDSADFGAFTTRKRVFIMFSKGPIKFPEPTHHKKGKHGLIKWNACREKIDLTNEGTSIFNRKKPLALNSIKRLLKGIEKE